MILMVTSGTHRHKDRCRTRPDKFGHLVTPRNDCGVQMTPATIGIDNDRFNTFYDEDRFLRTLGRMVKFQDRIKFVAAPDTPFDSAATLREFRDWGPRIRNLGFPVALVLQNGMKAETLPWGAFDAVFVGADDAYKLGQDAATICIEARSRGLWTHMGRVNSILRLEYCRSLQTDSVDGSGWAKFDREMFGRLERCGGRSVDLRLF